MENIEELQAELEALKEKCLKKNGEPRANVTAEDIARLEELEAKMAELETPDNPTDDETAPEANEEFLSDAEQIELEGLETRARNVNREPFPQDMLRLAALRQRPHREIAVVHCEHCYKAIATSNKRDIACPHCKKTTYVNHG